MARGQHGIRRRFGAPAVAVTVAAALSLAAGGVVLAAYRYDQARADLILPGISVEGVDVGGMSRGEAVAAVSATVDGRLDEPIEVGIGDRLWRVTPSRLGERADVDPAVEQAFTAGSEYGFLYRSWHRFRREPVGIEIEPTYGIDSDIAIRAFVDDLARRVAVAPTDAAITIGADGGLAFIRPKLGRRLRIGRSVEELRAALASDLGSVTLAMREVAPKITAKTLGPTIVVRLDLNRLELYEGFKVDGAWDVATAKPGWTTPTGVWTIWDKRENPTWYNPALDDWGADLPAVIPGGPGNPMGTRALYIDAPGLIRIHGTSSDESIGRYASHGCIRMHNWEVEELFDRVPVGSHVIVVGSRPSWAQEWDTPAASDI